MSIENEVQHEISHAIKASENIVACLHAGDYEGAKRFDLDRANFIRTLSKCRNIDSMMPTLKDDLQTLSELNKSIILLSRSLRDDVLTQIQAVHNNKNRHEEYFQHQNILEKD